MAGNGQKGVFFDKNSRFQRYNVQEIFYDTIELNIKETLVEKFTRYRYRVNLMPVSRSLDTGIE